MKPAVSLPCLKQPTTSSYTEPRESTYNLTIKTHFKIIFLSMPRSPKWSLLFRFFNWTFNESLMLSALDTHPVHIIILDLFILIVFCKV